MEGELMYAHPPRCSSTALPYTKQLKSRSYIFWFCWQLLPSHQRLIKAFWMLHLVCYLPDGIIIPVRKAGRSLIPDGHASRESTSRIMVPRQVLPPLLSARTCTPLETVSPTFLLKELHKNWQGSSFSSPALAVRVALAHCRALTLLFTCCTHRPC